ncbi:sensor histidine kinase [Nonomuraea terrae]|uniref:histidine kinase n=1 Tax=Nonomuraea terrae TaxID=2530383 RepID=A0A4R4YEF7_9ACTN|nr:HAMP domain-containing sensor histidine kinase [Nonomuraea terrae]TDD43095.1 sensor histidine kinase [Nonomuraea terrae]
MIVLLVPAFLIVGVTAEVTLNKVLYDRVDGQLTAAADRAPRAFDLLTLPGPSGCMQPRGRGFPPGQVIGTLAARICHGMVVNADVLMENGQMQPEVSNLDIKLLAVPVGAAPRSYDLGELGDYRLVARNMPDGAVLVTGLPLADTKETLYLVAGVVAGVTVLVLLAVAYIGVVIVGRALRPLSRVASTATRVSQLTLDRGEVELPQRVAEHDADVRTEVGQVGAALNRMLDHVGNALEVRHASEMQVRQFVADASHELRTPLAAIRGYAELSRRTGRHVPPEVAQMLSRVESEAQRMTALVEDLLLLARLDAGRPLAHEPVDLSMLTVNAVGDAHAASPQHDWRLDLPEEPVRVVGDPARLQQVLANLLANARIHTPEGTRVTVSVGVRGEQAVLRVADTGPGIPAELQPHIFERFARGDGSRSREAGSTGLGLAIVHAVLAAQGGTVEVDSVPGRTRFTVRLPLTAVGAVSEA